MWVKAAHLKPRSNLQARQEKALRAALPAPCHLCHLF